MKRVLAALAVTLCFSTASSAPEIPHPEEGVGAEQPLHPAPYYASAKVITSSLASTTLEIEISVTEPGRLPSTDTIPVGLIAVAPTGNISAAIIETEGSPVDDLSNRQPVLPASMPTGIIRVADPVIWRDLRLVGLSVTPCWESSQSAMVAARFVVTVHNTGGIGINEKTRPVTAVSPIWDGLYRRYVLNYNTLNLPQFERGTGNRYIVISRTAFDEETPQFVEWKTKQGYGVKLVTLEEITGQENPYPPNQANLDATRDYIQDAYDNWSETPEFVLLVGDMDSSNYSRSIWTESFYNYFYGQGNRPHDQWYGFLEGVDFFADIMVGRFPDTNSSRMGYMFSKSIAYEKTPYIEPGNDWQSHAIMTLRSNISETIDVKNLVSDLTSAWGMDVDEFFGSPWNVIPAMSEGFTFYNYRGDNCGSTDWWGTFEDSDVGYVQNIKKPGVFTILSCSSACFDYSYNSTAELLLRHGYTDPANYKGAIAFMGSQAYTSYEYNNPLDEGFYRQWTSDTATILGEAFLGAKTWAWEHMYPGYDPNRRDCMMKEYTILGDPSLQLWTNVPESMTANSSPSSVPMGQTTNITISVSETRGPVNSALVCLRRVPDVYVYGYTNALGQVTLPVSPTSMGTLDLTVTASNLIPVFDSIDVVPSSGPYVVYAGNTVIGDGHADIGETVSMNVTLENIGSATAYSVYGTLSTKESAITMITSTRGYGNIAPGTTALPVSPYMFDVGSFADQTAVSFDLAITSGDSLWNDGFIITIFAPALSLDGIEVLDPSGNGNGQPDPGETVELKVLVANSASGTAQGAEITLNDSDPYVTITGPTTQGLGDIAPDAQATSPGFSVTFDASCPPGYAASIPVHLESNGGFYHADTTLTLMVGQYDLLFVDTDNEATEDAIVTALDAWGGQYQRLDVYNQETVPLETLTTYRMIVWAAGDQNVSSLTPTNQANLASYLDQGGALLLTAENYLSTYDDETFTTDYLHVSSFDINIEGSTVNGEAGDPIGDGVSVTLSYPADLSNTPDRINPDAEASVVFRMQGSNDPVVLRYPSDGSGTYRVVFFAVALETFPTSGSDPNNIQTVVARALAWLDGGDFIAPTIPADPDYAANGALTWSASSDNVGVDHYCVYRNTLAYFDVGGLTPLIITSDTSVSLPEGIGNPDLNYFFRVTAKDAADNESQPSATVGEFDLSLSLTSPE